VGDFRVDLDAHAVSITARGESYAKELNSSPTSHGIRQGDYFHRAATDGGVGREQYGTAEYLRVFIGQSEEN